MHRPIDSRHRQSDPIARKAGVGVVGADAAVTWVLGADSSKISASVVSTVPPRGVRIHECESLTGWTVRFWCAGQRGLFERELEMDEQMTTDSPIVRMEFRRGDSSADQLQTVVDEVLAELRSPDSEAAQAARDAGLAVDDVARAQVEVREGQQGLEPVSTTIIVGIAVSIGSKIAESLWKDVLWPRIRRRLGWTAIKEPTGAGDQAGGGAQTAESSSDGDASSEARSE